MLKQRGVVKAGETGALTDESDGEGIKWPCIWGGPRGTDIIQLWKSIRSTTGQFWQYKQPMFSSSALESLTRSQLSPETDFPWTHSRQFLKSIKSTTRMTRCSCVLLRILKLSLWVKKSGTAELNFAHL